MQNTTVQQKLIKAKITQSFSQRLYPLFASNPFDSTYKNPLFEFRASNTIYGYTKGYGANEKFYVLIELDTCNIYLPIPIENTSLTFADGLDYYNNLTRNNYNNGQVFGQEPFENISGNKTNWPFDALNLLNLYFIRKIFVFMIKIDILPLFYIQFTIGFVIVNFNVWFILAFILTFHTLFYQLNKISSRS